MVVLVTLNGCATLSMTEYTVVVGMFNSRWMYYFNCSLERDTIDHWLFLLHKVNVKSLSHVQLFVTPRTVVYQAPPSIGFSRQEYLSGLSLPSPGDLPNPGIEPGYSTLQADSFPS